VLLAKLERKDVDRIMLAKATTARDVGEASRIVLVGDADLFFGLVLAVGPGTVYETGKRVEVGVRAGDVILTKGGAAKLDLPFRAKDLVTPLALPEHLHNLQVCMMHEALFEAVVEAP
jgi:co-chaperonin GroES (HSP10)